MGDILTWQPAMRSFLLTDLFVSIPSAIIKRTLLEIGIGVGNVNLGLPVVVQVPIIDIPGDETPLPWGVTDNSAIGINLIDSGLPVIPHGYGFLGDSAGGEGQDETKTDNYGFHCHILLRQG
jgi:hypothetical protein